MDSGLLEVVAFPFGLGSGGRPWMQRMYHSASWRCRAGRVSSDCAVGLSDAAEAEKDGAAAEAGPVGGESERGEGGWIDPF